MIRTAGRLSGTRLGLPERRLHREELCHPEEINFPVIPALHEAFFSRDNRPKRHTHLPVCTAGELFPDGGALELIRAAGDSTLLLFDGHKHVVAPRIEFRGQVFEPLKVHPSILRALTLPTKCEPYGSTRELFTAVAGLIQRVAPVSESAAAAIAFIVFATWFVDLLPVAPFLWVVVPPTASADALSQVLRLLCRRALCVGQLTTVALRSMPMDLQPTIVTQVSKVTPDLIRVLCASNHRGTYLPVRNKMVDLYCAKIVFADQPLPDPASAGFPLEIALAPSCEYAPPLNLAEAQQVAEEFQPKLLHYRLLNHRKITLPQFDLSGFTAPMQALAQSLGACIVDDDELQSQIVTLLKPCDREIQVDRAALLESIVLEALLTACHGAQSGALSMNDLTQAVNTILRGRGEKLEVSAETVGRKLRALDFRTDFIAGGRKGLTLLEETRKKIHALAADYGVRMLRAGPTEGLCGWCMELAAALPGGAGPADPAQDHS